MTQEKKLVWIHRLSPILYDLALAALCLYIWLRAKQWLGMLLPVSLGLVLGLILAGYYVLNLLTIRHRDVSKAVTYLTSVGTFVVMYLSMTILAVDLLRWILRLLGVSAPVLAGVFFFGGLACLVLTVLAVVLGMLHARHLVTVRYAVPVEQLSRDVRLVLLTDLHIGHFVGKKHIRELVSQVNRLKPDLVLISGDLINAGNTRECPDIDQVARELRGLHTANGVFAVTGNHDPVPEDPDFHDFLRRSRIHLLEDQVCTAGPVQLVGRKSRIRPRMPLAQLMQPLNEHQPVIVLDHDPIGIREARQAGADCVLCGHTHKGQVFPLDLLVRLLYPREELWGMGRQGKTTSIVSAGAGYFSMPMRLGSDSEIVCVDLKAGG